VSASPTIELQAPRVFLTEELFVDAVGQLAQRDADLATVLAKYGRPVLWVREPGFPSLVYIILEQQVSLASARAAYQRLLAATTQLTPARFLHLSDVELKAIGFSRQKTLYTRLLAAALARGHFDLRHLPDLHDDAARRMLIALKGIGNWTADIYLLSALRRPDVWPVGDLALATAVQEVKRLRVRPSPEKLEKMSAPWRPYRAVAARLFWHAYLCKRGQNTATQPVARLGNREACDPSASAVGSSA
jgi:DNA-3-methyladenine glycosylase II